MNNQRNRISGAKRRANLGGKGYNRTEPTIKEKRRNATYRNKQKISEMSKNEFVDYFTKIIKADKNYMESQKITDGSLIEAAGKYYDEHTTEISKCDENTNSGGIKTTKIINDIKKLAISIAMMIIVAMTLVGCNSNDEGKVNTTKFFSEQDLIDYTGVYDIETIEGLITLDGHVLQNINDYDVYRINIRSGESKTLQVRETRDTNQKGVIKIENGKYILASREVKEENGKKWVKVYNTEGKELYVREDCLERMEEYPKDAYKQYDINVITSSENGTLKTTTICDNEYYKGENGESEVTIPKKVADDKSMFLKIDEQDLKDYYFVTLKVDQPSISKENKKGTLEVIDFNEETDEIDNPNINKGSTLIVKEYDQNRIITLDGYILDKNDTTWKEVTLEEKLEDTTKMNFDYKNGPGEIEGVLGIDVAPGQSMGIDEFRKLLQSNIAKDIDKNAKPKFVYLKLGATMHSEGFSANSKVRDEDVVEFVKICEENCIPYGFYYYSQACTEREHDNEYNVILDIVDKIKTNFGGKLKYNVLPFALDIERGSGENGRMLQAIKNGEITKEKLTEYKEKLLKKLRDDENFRSAIIYASKNTFEELLSLDGMSDENKSNMWLVCPKDTKAHGEYISKNNLDDNTVIRQVILDRLFSKGNDYDVNFMTKDFYEGLIRSINSLENSINDKER